MMNTNETNWISGNRIIHDFIRETRINSAKYDKSLKWIKFNEFLDLKQVGEGGFAKVYLANWSDRGTEGKKYMYTSKKNDMIIKKFRTLPDFVALKSVKGIHEISKEYLNEMEIYYRFTLRNKSLSFYGLTKNPDNNEIMMVTGFASNGSLRGFLANNFPNLLWKKKLTYLKWIIQDLKNLHEQGICHKDFHSGNILLNNQIPYLTDFGLSGPANKDSKEIFGILTYVAPEVLKGKLYTASADIYSFGIIMTELSTGFPPHYNNKFNDDSMLALSICGGLRPDFGKGTPEVYKNLAHECMDANANKRPTAEKLENIILYLCDCLAERITDEEAKKIKAAFDKADNEIPNIQSKTNSDVKHTSKPLHFNDLPEPVNSSLIPAYADSGQIGINLPDDVDYDMDDDDDND